MARKEIVFGWCQMNQHEKCRVQYGDNIFCICDECPGRHGIDHVAAQKLSQQQVKEVVARVNMTQKRDPNWSALGDGYQAPKTKVYVKPNLDADTIEELERRRAKP